MLILVEKLAKNKIILEQMGKFELELGIIWY